MQYWFFKIHSMVLGILCIALFVLLPVSVSAQDAESSEGRRFFETKARAVNGGELVSGKISIQLWGVQSLEGSSASFLLEARDALDSALGSQKIRCEIKNRTQNDVLAQCTNNTDLDLGLYMLQQGYVVVDRGVVYGSVFETPYLDAEARAQAQKLGVWKTRLSSEGNTGNNGFLFILGVVLMLIVLAGFAVLVMTIMRGFQRVSDAQKDNMDMIARERALRDKEREIFATMLDSEIKANKSKIEAYLVVYDEMLKDLKVPDTTPKYKRAGDIVQTQPSLGRAVFDRNTDKLDILGSKLSGEIIHFYAGIKNAPEYVNLEPEMDLEDVIGIVEKSYEAVKRLNSISDQLIDALAQGGHSSEEY